MQTDGRPWARATALRALAMMIASALVVGCSGGVVLDPNDGPVNEPRRIARAMAPTDPVSALEFAAPGELALAASQLFFDSAQVVVLANANEAAGVNRAASLAVTLGTPVLLTAPPGQSTSGKSATGAGAQSGSLNTELVRLGTRAVLTVGGVSLHQLDTTSLVVSPVPADDEELAVLIDTGLTPADPPAPSDAVGELAELDPGVVYRARDLGPAPNPYGTLPSTLPAERVSGVQVFAGTDTRFLAAVATARAAGADVLASDDPGSSTRAVAALAQEPDLPVVGMGSEFTDPEQLTQLVNTLRSGQTLASDTQRVFQADGESLRVLTVDADVALAHELNNAGEVLERSADLARQQAQATGATTLAGVEVNARRASPSDLDYWAQQSAAADQFLILTFSASGSLVNVLDDYADLLALPHVGVRIRLGADDVLDAGEINDAIVHLKREVREELLPQKLFLLEITDAGAVAHPDSLLTTSNEVALAIAVAGPDQAELWSAARSVFSSGTHWGWTLVPEEGDEEGESEPRYPGPGDVPAADVVTYR